MSKANRSARLVSGAAAVLLSGLLLSACGGSSGNGDGPGAGSNSPEAPGGPVADDGRGSVPAEASSSVAAMMAWAKSLVASDTAEPLKTNTFKAPLDETTETSPG